MSFPLLALAGAVGGYYAYTNHQKKKATEQQIMDKTVFTLSSGDISMNDFSGISTVTFYNGALPLEFLRSRTCQILKQNPWLASRLYSTTKGVVGAYPSPKELTEEGYFSIVHIANFRNGCSFEEASRILYPYQVKKGKDCIDTNEPLFKVALVTTDSSENMLVVSLSHTLGDGYTFYKIYSMFEKLPEPMIISRVETFNDDMKAVMGSDVFNFMLSPGTLIGIISNVAKAKAFPIKNNEVDQNIIEKEKQKFNSESAFISTNDIITSWAFNMSGCNYGMMALNLRNRVKTVTDNHAGNYEGSLIFKPPYSPTDIRSSLKALKVPQLPTFWDGYSGNNTVVSNWASFYHELVIGGMKPVNHHPLEGDKVFLVKCTTIIYKPTAEKLAVLYGDTNPGSQTPSILKT
ncbi:hypothetical protein HDV04_001642 [Boothiomyces sp. JEL0838]|nr:hypothetical protein HDV04_001642 [Boothiomyces sp. JEL0838]